MSRPRVYKDNATRQKAYRERKAETLRESTQVVEQKTTPFVNRMLKVGNEALRVQEQ